MFEAFTTTDWLVVMFASLIQGMSKGGVPGISILSIPFVAMIIPGKESTGLLLPTLIAGDLFALAYWRRGVSVKDLLRALPWAFVGIVIGWFLLDKIENAQMRPIIGVTVMFILAIHLFRKWNAQRTQANANHELHGIWKYAFPAFMGALGGVTTMLANAAGPVIGAYLLSLRLTKETFMGTCAWFFFIVNWVKFPFMVQQDMITLESLKINAMMLPALCVGICMGVFIAKRINQKTFDRLVTTLALLASLRLLF